MPGALTGPLDWLGRCVFVCMFILLFFAFLILNIYKCSFFFPKSFCASLHQELKEYYRLLSVLHSQVCRTFYHWVVINAFKTRWCFYKLQHCSMEKSLQCVISLNWFPSVLQLQVEDDQGMNVCTESSLTLRRLLVWMYDPKVRLKTLAALVDFCQGELMFCYPDSYCNVGGGFNPPLTKINVTVLCLAINCL